MESCDGENFNDDGEEKSVDEAAVLEQSVKDEDNKSDAESTEEEIEEYRSSRFYRIIVLYFFYNLKFKNLKINICLIIRLKKIPPWNLLFVFLPKK